MGHALAGDKTIVFCKKQIKSLFDTIFNREGTRNLESILLQTSASKSIPHSTNFDVVFVNAMLLYISSALQTNDKFMWQCSPIDSI